MYIYIFCIISFRYVYIFAITLCLYLHSNLSKYNTNKQLAYNPPAEENHNPYYIIYVQAQKSTVYKNQTKWVSKTNSNKNFSENEAVVVYQMKNYYTYFNKCEWGSIIL